MMTGVIIGGFACDGARGSLGKRLDRKFRESSPKVGLTDSRCPALSAPGVRSFPVAMGFGWASTGSSCMSTCRSQDYDSAPAGGWDPMARLKDQDIDGVTAEVMYTTLGMPLFGMDDLELQMACFRVYNDFVAEYCSAAPRRCTEYAWFRSRTFPRRSRSLSDAPRRE